MRTLILISVLTVTLACVVGTAAAETKGWGLGAGAFSGDFTVQARKNFWLGGDVSQITGQAGVTFASKALFRIEADYHFVIKQGKSRFYPLAGLVFAFTTDHVKFGANGGGGINFMLTEKMAAFGEVKYTFSDWDGWYFIGGVFF